MQRTVALLALVVLASLALSGGAREAADIAPMGGPSRPTEAHPSAPFARAGGADGAHRRGDGFAVEAAGSDAPRPEVPTRAERQEAAARAAAGAQMARQRLFAENLASLEAAAAQADSAGNAEYAQALRRRRDALVGRVQ